MASAPRADTPDPDLCGAGALPLRGSATLPSPPGPDLCGAGVLPRGSATLPRTAWPRPLRGRGSGTLPSSPGPGLFGAGCLATARGCRQRGETLPTGPHSEAPADIDPRGEPPHGLGAARRHTSLAENKYHATRLAWPELYVAGCLASISEGADRATLHA